MAKSCLGCSCMYYSLPSIYVLFGDGSPIGGYQYVAFEKYTASYWCYLHMDSFLLWGYGDVSKIQCKRL